MFTYAIAGFAVLFILGVKFPHTMEKIASLDWF